MIKFCNFVEITLKPDNLSEKSFIKKFWDFLFPPVESRLPDAIRQLAVDMQRFITNMDDRMQELRRKEVALNTRISEYNQEVEELYKKRAKAMTDNLVINQRNAEASHREYQARQKENEAVKIEQQAREMMIEALNKEESVRRNEFEAQDRIRRSKIEAEESIRRREAEVKDQELKVRQKMLDAVAKQQMARQMELEAVAREQQARQKELEAIERELTARRQEVEAEIREQKALRKQLIYERLLIAGSQVAPEIKAELEVDDADSGSIDPENQDASEVQDVSEIRKSPEVRETPDVDDDFDSEEPVVEEQTQAEGASPTKIYGLNTQHGWIDLLSQVYGNIYTDRHFVVRSVFLLTLIRAYDRQLIESDVIYPDTPLSEIYTNIWKGIVPSAWPYNVKFYEAYIRMTAERFYTLEMADGVDDFWMDQVWTKAVALRFTRCARFDSRLGAYLQKPNFRLRLEKKLTAVLKCEFKRWADARDSKTLYPSIDTMGECLGLVADMNQTVVNGIHFIPKTLFMLTLLEGAQRRIFIGNRLFPQDSLSAIYKEMADRYVPADWPSKIPDFFQTYMDMDQEYYYHIQLKEGIDALPRTKLWGREKIMRYVEYTRLDPRIATELNSPHYVWRVKHLLLSSFQQALRQRRYDVVDVEGDSAAWRASHTPDYVLHWEQRIDLPSEVAFDTKIVSLRGRGFRIKDKGNADELFKAYVVAAGIERVEALRIPIYGSTLITDKKGHGVESSSYIKISKGKWLRTTNLVGRRIMLIRQISDCLGLDVKITLDPPDPHWTALNPH